MKRKEFSGFPKEGLQFLRSLKRNNNRDWFLSHKAVYEQAVKQPMVDLIEALAEDFAMVAPEIEATPKASLYRIYRDTRFSKDKSPYKTHVAAIFRRRGLGKNEGAGLYLHIAPTDVFVGGGLYMPFPDALQAIRMHIAENGQELEAIVSSKPFRRMFGSLSGEQLTRVPRGFPSDHPMADYLRRKQFLAGMTIDPGEAVTPQFYKTVRQAFVAMLPMVRFLNGPLVEARRAKERQEALLGI